MVKFLRKACLIDGHIILQFPAMKQITRDNTKYAFQTDSIEGWIKEDDHPAMCLTMTSTHSELLVHHVTVVMSITFNREGEDYNAHFDTLIGRIGYFDFEDFSENFPGNISDFSANEKLGFVLSVCD